MPTEINILLSPGMYLTSFKVHTIPVDVLRLISPIPVMSRVSSSARHFLPLLSVLNREPAVSPEFLLRISSFRIKSLIPLNVNFVVPDVLPTAVTGPEQLSGNEDNNNSACISSSKTTCTDVNLDSIELNSFT
ncbi:hypothetical protein AKJ16_DCAP24363 [Drosera capensis]